MPPFRSVLNLILTIATLAMMLICGGIAAAETCAPEPQGEARIAAVIDARTIRLDDGRLIRLAGLAPILETSAANELLSQQIGTAVSLHSDNDAPDRYGRQHTVVFPAGEETSLQIALLAAGAAVYDGMLDSAGCREEFTAAEAAARRAQIGIWAAPSRIMADAENSQDILDRIGQFVVVEGQVRSVRQAGGTRYLNFGRRWTKGFAVTIPTRSVAAFEAAGHSLHSMEGRKVRVRGIVDGWTGPRVEASRPMQVELVGPDAPATAPGIRR